ncbi:MAG: hypothetical protein AAF081_11840 [Actinomycetota bacterium]
MTDITRCLLATILAATMLFSITACSDDADTDEPPAENIGS